MKQGFSSTIAFVVLCCGASLSAPALASDGHYLCAQLAISDVNTHRSLGNGTAFAITYGVPLPRVQESLGIEAEYTQSLDNPAYDAATYHAELDYYTLAGYAVMTFPINNRFSLRARAGALYVNREYRDNIQGDENDNRFDLSIGGGATFALGKHMNLIAEITMIESNITHASAGAQLRF